MLVAPNNLLNLHRFKAGNNKITNVDVDTFAGMEKLYTIDLSDNELSEINIDMFRRMHSKMWGESLYYYYEEREWKEDTGYIDLQRIKFNASMKLAVMEYFVNEHDFVRVGDGKVKHKKGAFRVDV
jgi:Leucine-rich repeat (LRR) protein